MVYYHGDNKKHRKSGLQKIIQQIAAEKKKTITAVCLVAIMAFMWVRLLIGNKVEDTQADNLNSEQMQETNDIESNNKIKFTELPVVEGRNDVLKRDFFTIQNNQLQEQKKQDVEIVTKQEDEEIIEKISKKMKLNAITMGTRPEAFINDKLLGIGDTIIIAEGMEKYECEIIEIKQMEVAIKCGQEQAILKLAQIEKVLDENEY